MNGQFDPRPFGPRQPDGLDREIDALRPEHARNQRDLERRRSRHRLRHQDQRIDAGAPDDHDLAGVLRVEQAYTHEIGRRVAVAGVVTHRQRPGTAGGITFLSLEDETGLLNVICSAGLWQKFRKVARTSRALVVRGRLERSDGATNLVAEHLTAMSLKVRSASRDFR